MKRTLKRSRLLGMLAVLLTMSLVTAFGTPVAVADPDGKQQGKQKSSQSRAQKCNPKQGKGSDDAQPRHCEESANPSDEAADDDGRAANDSSQKRSENGTRSSGKRGDASESKSSKSDNSSRAKASGSSNSNSAQSKPQADKSKGNNSKSSSQADSKSNSEGKSSKGNSKSKSEGKSSKGNSKSKSEGKSSKGNNSKSNRDSKGNRGESRGNGAESHPPGNNGTVKIDGVPFDDHPDNEPHPGCTFQVDFYNYDEGDLSASVTFTTHPPTDPSGEIVLTESGISIGEDPAMGGTDLDATRTYALDLSGYEPHDQQGHHIKLTVNAEGSIGADTKHKVFWVDCAADSSAPDVVDVEDEVVEVEVEDEVEADRDEAEVTEEEEVSGRDEAEVAEDSVLGTIIQRGAPSGPSLVQGTTEVAGQQDSQQETRGAAVLPFTGAGLTAFIVLALALVGTGIAALATRRRSET